MATRNGTMLNDNDGKVKYVWTGILNADNGSTMGTMEHVAEYAFQVTGTFGAAGAVALQGSSDGTNWATLDDVGGTSVSATASTKVWRVANLPDFIRVLSTAGDGTTLLTARLSGAIR